MRISTVNIKISRKLIKIIYIERLSLAKYVYRPKLFILYALNLLHVPFFTWILNTFSFPAIKNGIGIDTIFSSKLSFHWEMPSYQDKNHSI